MKKFADAMHIAAPLAVLLGALALGTFPGCSAPPDANIAKVTPATADDAKTPPTLTTKERLRVQDMVAPGGAADPHAGMTLPNAGGAAPATDAASGNALPPSASPSEFAYTLPTGWQEAPATAMRSVNLKIGEASECYVTVLGGDGGGLGANLNRWRKQMGQPDLSEADLAALPKHPLLGADASYIVIDGTFSGMGGIGEKPDYRMLGLAQIADGRAVFVKFTGPRAEIEAQTANFEAFVTSLSREAAPAPAAAPAAAPAPAPAAPAAAPAPAPAPAAAAMPSVPVPTGAGLDTSKLQWVAPPSWTRAPDRVMRLVTYTVGQSECYITLLDGPAGGVEANLNRWRGQMGAAALTPEEVAQLPKLPVMGKEGMLIEAKGNFTTMSGQTLEGQMLAGVICLLDNGLLTVKMTGPEAEVTAELESFKAFCASISMN